MQKKEQKIVKLTFLGDVMCKSQMIPAYSNKEEDGTISYDFTGVFQNVQNFLRDSDIVCANLETPISFNNEKLTNAQFCFNSPYEFALAAKEAGIDFVATANNHCLDRGIDGLHSTIKSLNAIGLLHTGVFDKKKNDSCITTVAGVKIAFLSYTYGTNAFSNHNYLPKNEYWRVNLFQNQELSSKIDKWAFEHKKFLVSRAYFKVLRLSGNRNHLKPIYERKERSFLCRLHLLKDIFRLKREKPDFVVMYMHAGGQYNPQATDDTIRLANYLLDHGVNIVAGTHEHVVHSGLFSKIGINKLATFSLGNFDGVAGVYEAPFDKMANYSIAWHVYIDTISKRIVNSSFTVLKTVLENKESKRIQTVPVFDLYEREKNLDNKQKLFDDYKTICERFLGHEISYLSIGKEQMIT